MKIVFFSLRISSITRLEIFCKDLVDINYENTSVCILESSIWMHLIYSLTSIPHWFAKCIFPINRGIKLTTSESKLKILLCVAFISQNSYYGKFAVLHNLISIVLNCRIKSRDNFTQSHAVPGLFFKTCSVKVALILQKWSEWLQIFRESALS